MERYRIKTKKVVSKDIQLKKFLENILGKQDNSSKDNIWHSRKMRIRNLFIKKNNSEYKDDYIAIGFDNNKISGSEFKEAICLAFGTNNKNIQYLKKRISDKKFHYIGIRKNFLENIMKNNDSKEIKDLLIKSFADLKKVNNNIEESKEKQNPEPLLLKNIIVDQGNKLIESQSKKTFKEILSLEESFYDINEKMIGANRVYSQKEFEILVKNYLNDLTIIPEDNYLISQNNDNMYFNNIFPIANYEIFKDPIDNKNKTKSKESNLAKLIEDALLFAKNNKRDNITIITPLKIPIRRQRTQDAGDHYVLQTIKCSKLNSKKPLLEITLYDPHGTKKFYKRRQKVLEEITNNIKETYEVKINELDYEAIQSQNLFCAGYVARMQIAFNKNNNPFNWQGQESFDYKTSAKDIAKKDHKILMKQDYDFLKKLSKDSIEIKENFKQINFEIRSAWEKRQRRELQNNKNKLYQELSKKENVNCKPSHSMR